MQRLEFRAMGTDIEVLLATRRDGAGRALAAAPEWFERLEQTFSRFRPDSELSRLNRARTLAASDEFVHVVKLALTANTATAGRYDPTLGDAVVAAGYSVSFEAMSPSITQTRPRPRPASSPVVVDSGTRTITLGEGVRLDLGGIAKGYAAQVVADALGRYGPCLVNAGGDIATCGVPAGGEWPVGVPLADDRSMTLALRSGALATSGRDRRTWTTDLGPAHHVIDPANGRPAQTDLLRVTAVAADGPAAEVAATALLVGGSRHLVASATALHVEAVGITDDGEVVATERLR